MIERKLSTGQLGKLIGVNRATVWRWIDHGITIRGQHIKLGCEQVGTRKRVTLQHYAEFTAAQAAANGMPGDGPDVVAQIVAAEASGSPAEVADLVAETERRRAKLAQIQLESRLHRRGRPRRVAG